MIRFVQRGNFKKLDKYLDKAKNFLYSGLLEVYGKKGVEALYEATPKRTGLTAASWYYKVERDAKGNVSLNFYNSNIQNGVCVALLIQYGHRTSRGYWVQGRDYINPALQPIIDKLAKDFTYDISKNVYV